MGGKKNTKGGKGHKKGKREIDTKQRELEFKDEGQDYAQVSKMLGDGRVQAQCFDDGAERICHIRGKFRKRVWIAVGDIILLGLRDFQDDKADIIMKYTPDEARCLKAYGEIPESVVIGSGVADGAIDAENEGGDLAFGSDNEQNAEPKEPEEPNKEPEEPNKEPNKEPGEDWSTQLAEL